MTEIKYNIAYKRFLTAQQPRQILFGGSSSGKSVFLAQRTIIDVLANKRNYLIVRNVAKTIRQSTYNEIVKQIHEYGFSGLFSINKTDMTITAFNGYQIQFAGLDDVQKLKSITPTKGVTSDVWIEEATEIDYESYKEITKRLRGVSDFKGSKRITLSFNPIFKTHWIYKEFFDGWQDEQKLLETDDLLIQHSTYKDNSFLTEEDCKALENETDEYYYRVYTLGQWGVLGHVVFKRYKVADLTEQKKQFDNPRNGQDFGFAADPAATICTHYDQKHKTIYVYDELYKKGLTNDLLANELRRLIGYQVIRCDSAEPKSIQELKNEGIHALPAKKGKDSVLYGIQWLQQHDIVIDKNCQQFINEIQQYQWKTDGAGNAIPVPVDKNNHLIDALRYAYSDEMRGTQSGFVNVKI